jgi:hypothetical protein
MQFEAATFPALNPFRAAGFSGGRGCTHSEGGFGSWDTAVLIFGDQNIIVPAFLIFCKRNPLPIDSGHQLRSHDKNLPRLV